MSSRPCRIQLRRTRGWRMPPNTVKVTRGPGMRWGNPWVVGYSFVHTNADAVRLFRGAVIGIRFADGSFAKPQAHPESLIGRIISDAPKELRGKNLACWCRLCDAHKDGKPLGEKCHDCDPCHADVLLEIANRPFRGDPQEEAL